MADDLTNIISNMDNMSIEELGGSLLSRQSKLNAQREKEAKKNQKIQNALALIGIGQALTKDAFKKRNQELDNVESFAAGNNAAQSESWRIKSNIVNDLEDKVDFDESEDYKSFRADAKKNPSSYDFYNFTKDTTEGDYRAAYLHSNNYLEMFTNQFSEPMDKVIKSIWGRDYEALVADSKTYNYLLDSGGYDIARHFLKDVGTDGVYRAQYENFMDEALSLLTQDNPDSMDRETALNITMGLSEEKLNQLERDYFKRQRNIRDKGLLGGIPDIFRKVTGISKRNNSPNMFDTISKQDFYGNRLKSDGQFELNVSSLIQQSMKENITTIKSGGKSDAPIGPDSNARIIYNSKTTEAEEFRLLVEGDGNQNGVGDEKGFFVSNMFDTLSWAEQREDLAVHMIVPQYQGENVTERGARARLFKTSNKTKYLNYIDGLSTSELNEYNQQIGILATEMKEDETFARDAWMKVAGTVDGWDNTTVEGRKEINEYFDRKYSTEKGILTMATAMTSRNGLYSKNIRSREVYRAPEDIVDTFNKNTYPPAFNKNGGILAQINNNIYISEKGFEIKEDYHKLPSPQKAEVFHKTFEQVTALGKGDNPKIDNDQLQGILNNLFETIPHPMIGYTTAGEYASMIRNEDAAAILMGANEKYATEPTDNLLGTIAQMYGGMGMPTTTESKETFNKNAIRFMLNNDIDSTTTESNETVDEQMSKLISEEEKNLNSNNEAFTVPGLDLLSPRLEKLKIVESNIDSNMLNTKMSNLVNTTGFAESRDRDINNPKSNALSFFQFIGNNPANVYKEGDDIPSGKKVGDIKQQALQTTYNRLVENIKDYGGTLPADLDIIVKNGFTSLDGVSKETQTLLLISNYAEDKAVDIKTGKYLGAGVGTSYFIGYLNAPLGSQEEKKFLKLMYTNVHHKTGKVGTGITPKILSDIDENFETSYDKIFN